MNAGDWFTVANTLLCVGAAVAYACSRQWPSMMYWMGAVILNVGVLWLKLKG